MTTTTEPTLLEKVHALEVTVRRLVAERDCAFQLAGHTTRELASAHNKLNALKAQLLLRDNLIKSLRINNDAKNNTIRRLTARVRELALADENKQRRLNAAQQSPERKSWLSRRIGNQL